MKNISIFILISLMFSDTMIAQDWPNLAAFKEVNKTISPPAPNENRVVFMGNSITIGWEETVPEYFQNNPYINRGIGGQTTPQMLIRFREDVVHLRPAVVHIMAGTNDIAGNTGPSSLEMIMDNLKSMAEIAYFNNIEVILCSVLPAYDYPWEPGKKPYEKIPALNKMIKAYAEENNFIYLDYFRELNDGKNGMIAEYTSDGVHVTKAGYLFMQAFAEKAIQAALAKRNNTHGWSLVFRNDAKGNVISGSKKTLISAVRNGYDVRIGWGSFRASDPSKSVEHITPAQFLTITNQEEVFAQINPIIGQSPDLNSDTTSLTFRENLQWSIIVGTNGFSDRLTIDKIDNKVQGHRDLPTGVSWYVNLPNRIINRNPPPLYPAKK